MATAPPANVCTALDAAFTGAVCIIAGGDLAKKIESFKKKGVTTVHLSTCTRGKNENYESIAEQCAEAGFDVVGYTHGAAVSKDGKEAVILSAKDE